MRRVSSNIRDGGSCREKLAHGDTLSGGPWLERDAQMFADRVNELSGGEIAIEVYPGGTLGSALKVTNTVKSGVAEVSHNYINYDYGTDPTTALLAGHSSGLTLKSS